MDQDATAKTKARCDRIAPIDDLMEAAIESLAFHRWRRRLWSHVDGRRVLEVGIGTGKNILYHPPRARITAVGISHRCSSEPKGKVQVALVAKGEGVKALIRVHNVHNAQIRRRGQPGGRVSHLLEQLAPLGVHK